MEDDTLSFSQHSLSGGANLSGHMVVVLCYLEANPPGLLYDRERSEDH
jgi:hypothetical protein